jgi:VWFA-related protein
LAAAATAAIVASAASAARVPQTPGRRGPVFRAATDLVLVHFHVVRRNHYVGGVGREDIVLYDNGRERPVDFFEGGCGDAARTVPATVGLLFDTSSSVMNPGLLNWIASDDALLEAATGAAVSVYGFDESLRRYSTPTRDPASLRNALGRISRTTNEGVPGAETIPFAAVGKQKVDDEAGNVKMTSRVYESVMAAARDLASTSARRMLLVFSDGQRMSFVSLDDITADLQALDVAVFPVLLGHQVFAAPSGSGRLPDDAVVHPYGNQLSRNVLEFGRLGVLTGGRSFDPMTLDRATVRTLLAIVAENIRCEYVAGIAPGLATGVARRHDLQVKLRKKATGQLTGGRRTVVC